MKVFAVIFTVVLAATPIVRGALPMVAIHDSELTRTLETIPASGATPTGSGTTGYQWWPTQWHYFVMPDAAKQALISDGTAFTVVSDANINAGNLLDVNGNPVYPIVISFASEAISDTEAAKLTNYVAAGGFLLVGSSSFTRNTDGTSRGDFAIANQMGVHMLTSSLQNWTNNFTFTKLTNNQIISHIPGETVTWQMPSAADEVSWPYQGVFAPERLWMVQPGDASVIAKGDGMPYILIKSYGKGYFIYDAAMQPLIGHGGYAPGMYAYEIFRKSIEWAFQSARVAIPKLSPWPYAYDSAFIARHDLENFGNEITNIAQSAQIENGYGAKGDYYFCTGTLRQELSNSPTAVAGLRIAITNYNATIGPHNGGFQNPQNAALAISDYDYWHWGPDQAYDVPAASLPLPGFPDGRTYALDSLSNSFADIEGWLGSLTNSVRNWVAPYFNATREASYQIEQQLNVKVTGDDKLSPFPSWTLSTQTPDAQYPLLQIPVSDWYITTQIGQALETGHEGGTIHELVDYYYNLGALVNLYTHGISTGNSFVDDYITYSLNPTLHPRIWSQNSLGINQWWLQRANDHISATFSTNGSQSSISVAVTGATDPQTAVEVEIPGTFPTSIQVLTNGTAASTASYRTNTSGLNNLGLKVLVGTTVTNVQVKYILMPTAQNHNYTTPAGQTLSVPASLGALAGAFPGAGASLTATLTINPSHGTLTFTNNGGFTYTPSNNYAGIDSFTYISKDGVTNSNPATITIAVTPTGTLFFDDFTRATNADPLAPWAIAMGKWNITNGVLFGTASGQDDFSDLYAGDPTWGDLSLDTDVQIPANEGAWDAGVGIRVNPLTGERYLINIYPEGSPESAGGGAPLIRVIKFHGWRDWNVGNPMITNTLPAVGGSVHHLKVTARGNRIDVFYDGTQVIDLFDTNYDNTAPFTNGAVAEHMFMSASFTASFDNLVITPLSPSPTANPDSYQTIENHTLVIPALGVLTNDLPGLGTNMTAVLVTGATNGTVTLSTNGGFTYVPNNNFFGIDTFFYEANDGLTNSVSTPVTITVLSNRPPVVQNDSYNMVEGHVLSVTAPGVLGNDSVGWGTNLTASLITGPAHGTLNLTNNGGFTYSPSPTYVGSDTFTYRANDGITNSTAATVTITVATNYPPVATNDAYSVLENQTLTIPAGGGVLTNDSDLNGDTLTAVLVTSTTSGTLSLAGNGGFTYTPGPNFVGTDGFTYQATDGVFTSAVASVTITVITNAGAYQPPVATNDSYNTVAGSTLSVTSPGILANDVAFNGGTLTAALVSGPAHGSLVLTNNGGFSYTSTNGFVGSDSFTYQAADGFSNSAPATVSILVAPNQVQSGLFFDDFTRPGNADILTPWIVALGEWNVTNGLFEGTASNEDEYANAYVSTNWGDYTVESRIQISADAFGQGICGRVNPANGANYSAVISPGSSTLQLIKFFGWGNWDVGNPMAQVSVPTVGTNWHTVKLAFRGNLIGVYYDGVELTNVADNSFDATAPYLTGGIGTHMFMTADFTALYDYFLVNPLVVDDSYNVNQTTNLVVAAPGVLANDTAISGSMTATLISSPTNGTVTLNADGSFTYTPTNGFTGTDSFLYSASDSVTNLGLARVTLQVAPQPTLTINIDNQIRAYGQTNPIFTGSLSGLQSGDTITATFSAGATTNSNVGTYPIVVAALNDPGNKLGNYIVVTNSGTLTVTQAVLTVSANNQSQVYGANNPALTASYIGFLNNDTSGVLSGAPVLNTPATTNSPVGPYSITVAQGTLSAVNYSFGFANGVLTVTPATLGVTADPKSISYGATNPIFTATYSGFLNGETTSVLSGAPSLTTLATTNTPVGQYAITAAVGTLSANNYVFSFTNGTLTIGQATLTVGANNQSRTYGATNPIFTANYSGFLNGDTTNVLTGAPVLTSSALTNSPAGNYAINIAAGTLSAANYAFSFTNGVLTVGKAMLTVTADNKSRTYGATNPVFTATITGFLNGDSGTVLSGSPAFSTTATTNSPVGPYTITPSLGTLSAFNYTFCFTNGVLNVGQASLTAGADNKSRIYGATNPAFTVSYIGLVNGETTNVLSGAPILTSSALTNSPVGNYAINITPGTLSAANYAFNFSNGVLSVGKATLTVSADNKSRGYGATNPLFSASYSGFVNGDGGTVLSGSPAFGTSAATNSTVGNYAITVTQGTLSAFNYNFSFTNGVLTVGQATLAVSGDNKSRVYGATNPVFTASYIGLLNGDTTNVLSGAPVLTTPATTNSPIGQYGINVSAGTLSATNYVFTTTNGVLTIGQAIITVSGDNKSRTYGATNPVFTASYSGFLNGDTTNVLTGTPALSTTATTNTPVGQYAITTALGTLNSTNYAFSFTNGVLTIGQAQLTVSADNQSRIYGVTNPVFTASYIGFLNGDTTNVLGGAPALTTLAVTNSPVGPYAISAALGTLTATNYAFNFTNGVLTIGQASILVSANNQSRTYGATNPVFAASYSGFLDGDTTNVLSGAPALSTAATTNSPVGPYTITSALGTLSSTNYAFTFSNGTLTIGQATLIASADNKSRTYGATNPVFTTSYIGLLNGDTTNVLSGAPALNTSALTNSPVGTYPITIAPGTLSSVNYAFSFTNGVLTVGKAMLTVTADNKSRAYGATNPVFTATVTGFMNGDGGAVLMGSPAFSTPATTNSPVGPYAIIPSVGTLTAFNYTFCFTNGVLTVGQAPLLVGADNKSRIYGATNPVFTASYIGLLNGDTTNVLSGAPALGTVAITNTPVGQYAITNAQGTLSAANYAFIFTNGVLTIGQATVTVTADNQSRQYGATNPTLTASFSGFANGETLGTSGILGQPGLSTIATPASLAGTYPINITQGTLSSTNYTFNLVNGTLTVVGAPVPVIMSLTGSGSPSVTVQWTSISNITYRLQYSSNLSSGIWSNVTPDVTATNSAASATDSPNGASVRFYRVLVVP